MDNVQIHNICNKCISKFGSIYEPVHIAVAHLTVKHNTVQKLSLLLPDI
jgi:hypothetical protein